MNEFESKNNKLCNDVSIEQSEIVKALHEAQILHLSRLSKDRQKQLKRVQQKVDDFDRRGLLKRQKYEGGLKNPTSIGGSLTLGNEFHGD